jgi:soluble lytic murein transglycosylase-like protein
MSVNSISSNGTVAANPERYANASTNTAFASVLSSSMNESGTDLDSIFEAASEKYDVPVNLLKAVAKAESNFNADATSSCGAMGIMQLMPSTAKSLGVTDGYDAEQNIMGGAKYLSQLLNQFDGDTQLAVAAYNAGAGNVMKYDGIPPFKETENYVDKVMGYYGNDITAGSISSGSISTGSNTSSYLQSLLSSTPNDSNSNGLSPLLLMGIYQLQMMENNSDDQKII